jgi:chorismate mutase
LQLSTRGTILRAVRGATTIVVDGAVPLAEKTTQLLQSLLKRNRLTREQIVSVVFTVTNDISSGSPLDALSDAGLSGVPAICAREIDVPGALPLCVRVLLHVKCSDGDVALEPIYLERAVILRPDLVAL